MLTACFLYFLFTIILFNLSHSKMYFIFCTTMFLHFILQFISLLTKQKIISLFYFSYIGIKNIVNFHLTCVSTIFSHPQLLYKNNAFWAIKNYCFQVSPFAYDCKLPQMSKMANVSCNMHLFDHIL